MCTYWTRIYKPSNSSLGRENKCHHVADNICDNRYENQMNSNRLWFEFANSREDPKRPLDQLHYLMGGRVSHLTQQIQTSQCL